MKVPRTFVPEKNLDKKIERAFQKFYKIASLIEPSIGNYWKKREHNPDSLITEYRHMKPAIECANIRSADYYGKEVSMTIFKLNKPANKCLEEISKGLESGMYEHYKHKCCLIKQDFMLVIKTLDDENGLEFFKNHHKHTFGFC
ncbi:hypothetical protein FJZ53_01135 [Candidatus Woesearchaeota archaeon]|nr:hypothetical protein [Candidatus Woesearchaeota archaeon]